jgi:acyl-CoA thioesterase-1
MVCRNQGSIFKFNSLGENMRFAFFHSLWQQRFFCVVLLCFSPFSLAKEKPTTLLVWGDSLSAAYNMPIEKGWVALLQAESKQLKIINGSISGETTQGGLTRLAAVLKQHSPDKVMLELGANDGLRGLPIKIMRHNLAKMIELIQASGAKVILAGMKIPPNYGFKYTKLFEQSYLDLAKKYQLTLIPFFLAGVADKFELMQADGLHPTAEAQHIILSHVKPFLKNKPLSIKK